MKMKVAAVAVAMVALVSLVPSTLAQAASSSTISTKGPFAGADIYSIDANGICREVYVYSSTVATKSPGGPAVGSAVTYAYYYVVDTTTSPETILDAGFGYIDGTLTVAKKLTSASLSASGTLTSFVDSSSHSVAADLDFTPSGPAQVES